MTVTAVGGVVGATVTVIFSGPIDVTTVDPTWFSDPDNAVNGMTITQVAVNTAHLTFDGVVLIGDTWLTSGVDPNVLCHDQSGQIET